MLDGRLRPAALGDRELKQVRALRRIWAMMSWWWPTPSSLRPAKLSAAKLKKLQDLEGKLGNVYLLAWKKPRLVCK